MLVYGGSVTIFLGSQDNVCYLGSVLGRVFIF